jgi:cytochrome c oxidase subunit 2
MESIYNLFGKLMQLPILASENGAGVDRLIILIHMLMLALFVGWSAYFLFVLWRFRAKRQPKADHYGVRGHASSYIEVGVAGIEIVILAVVAIPLWAQAVDVTKVIPTEGAVEIQVQGEQFVWNGRYTGPDGEFGSQDMQLISDSNKFGVDPDDPAGQDDIQVLNEYHVPVNKPVVAYISSKDVIHSFKVVAFRVCQDAIPGMRIPTWFTPTETGRYQVTCAQLCGNGHASMAGGFIVVDTQEDYDAWLASMTDAGDMNFE